MKRDWLSPECEHEVNLISEALLRFQAILAKKAAVREFAATDEMCAYRCSILWAALKGLIDEADKTAFTSHALDAKIVEAKQAITSVEKMLHRNPSYPGDEKP